MDVVLPLLPAAVVVVVVVVGEENEGRKSEVLRRGTTGAESGASPEPAAALLPLLGRLALSAEKNEDRPPDLGAEDEEDVDIDDGDEEDDDEASAAGAEVFLPSGAWKDEGLILLGAPEAPRGGGELPSSSSSSSSKGLGVEGEEEGRVVGDAGRGTSGGTTANSSSASNGLAEQAAALTGAAESPSSSSSKGFSDPPCPDISWMLNPTINKLKEPEMYFLDNFFSSS